MPIKILLLLLPKVTEPVQTSQCLEKKLMESPFLSTYDVISKSTQLERERERESRIFHLHCPICNENYALKIKH